MVSTSVDAASIRKHLFDSSSLISYLLELQAEALASGLEFPDYYGRNLDALNDCISDLEIPEESWRVLIFYRYDAFAAKFPREAWVILDTIESKSRFLLLFGRRLFALVQSADPRISFDPIGAHPVMWNRREVVNKSRGL